RTGGAQRAGGPAAILVRAVEPLAGIEAMRVDRVLRATTRRRSLTADRAAAAGAPIPRAPGERLASGPGLVTAAFGIDTTWSGVDLCDPASPLRLEAGPADEPTPTRVRHPRSG